MNPKYNILLGLTGSVAAKLAPKLVKAFSEHGNVRVVATNSARYFYDADKLGVQQFGDEDEWSIWQNSKLYQQYSEEFQYTEVEEQIPHIDLRRWASVFVIAPLSANTLGKMANGLCDNLLTSVVRAWDANRPMVLAPAMNTLMWEHPATQIHLCQISDWYPNAKIVMPIEKKLACNQVGLGAMALIDDIVKSTLDSLRWRFPLLNHTSVGCSGIPVGDHPGAFGFRRKYDVHSGVDLYCNPDTLVYAMEDGVVCNIESFTGPKDNSPWWNDTQCVMIEGASGVVNYGEIEPHTDLLVGKKVKKGEWIGKVIPVLDDDKARPDIPGHKTSMLHIELYHHGVYTPSKKWEHSVEKPPYGLVDPTPYLLDSSGRPPEQLSISDI